MLFLVATILTHQSLAADKVTLQLKWNHAFQFAGYYAAQEQGYYRDAGLDVDIRQALPGVDSLSNVLDGRAQYGVGTSNLLLARKQGKRVVVLAVIFQHSPLVLIARQTSAIQSIQDLVDKPIMIEPQSDELLAYLKLAGVRVEDRNKVVHSHNPQDLMDGKVDAMSAYITAEPYYLDRVGFNYRVFTPLSGGIDFYGDNLFTTEAELDAHPTRVAAFRSASLRGWQYAMAHPAQMADLIVAKYSQQHSREFYRFEAQQMTQLMQVDLIEVGYMNPSRWRQIADTYASLGLLPQNYPLEGFLYAAETAVGWKLFYVALALFILAFAIVYYNAWVTHRRVKPSVVHRT
jgi:ABC-type nitrate/sulfonate/bicarbonate transport system substrate-binding protein